MAFAAATLFACGNSNTQKDTANSTGDAPLQQSDVKQEAAPVVHAGFRYEDGTSVHTQDLEGKVVFINFWATWCPPCRKEMPSIQILHDKFKDNKDLVFLIVEIETDIEGTKKFLAEQNLSLPIVYPDGEIPSAWLGGAIPTTVILDKKGQTAAKQEGMYDFSTQAVEDFIQNLINE